MISVMPLQPASKKETDPLEALREVRSILDKRARNLEKKRNKLEVYKSKYDRGEKLNEDQTKAVERIDSVQKQIEIVIELHGNISTAVDVCEKANKKKEKRDRYEKERHDANHFAKLAEIQSLLQELGDESVRELFAKGEGGAILLSETELGVMDELFKMLNPTREVGETGPTFAERVRQTGDFVVSLLDGKDRPSNIGKVDAKEGENGDEGASGSSFSYKDLKELVEKILECEYFTSARIVSSGGDEEDIEEFVANAEESAVETSADAEATNGDLVNGSVDEVAAPISELREPEPEVAPANGSLDTEEDVAPVLPTRAHASWSEVAAGAEDKKNTSGLSDMIDHLQSSYTFVVDSRLDSPPSAPPAPVAPVPPAPIAATHQQQPQLTVPQTAPKGLAATSAPIPVPAKKSNWADDVEFANSGSWVDEPLPTFNDAHSPAAAPVPPPSATAPAPAAPEVDVFASASQSAYLQSGGDEGEDSGGSWQQQHARNSGHRGSGGRGGFRRDRDSRGGGAPRGFRGSRGGGNFRGGRGGGGSGGTWNSERSTSGGDRGWGGRGNYRGGGNFRGGNNFRGGYRGGGNVGDFERSSATAAAAGGNF